MNLNILSGGAAQGLVASLAAAFKAKTGFDIAGEYGAVGGMSDKLRDGAPADMIILTSALVAELAEEKLVVSSSISDVGLVETALAVRSGDPKVSATTVDDLRKAFLAADAIFVPDTKASTAGIHVAKVLDRLGIADEVAARLKIHPNGRPPCGSSQRPAKGARSAVRSRPRSFPRKALNYRGRCPRLARLRRCTPPP